MVLSSSIDDHAHAPPFNCRRCKSFIGYAARSRIRVGRGEVRVTCLLCGHVRRKALPK